MIIIGSTILLGGMIMLFQKPISIKNIKSFHFSTVDGMSMYDNTRYEIKCEDTCIEIVKPNGEQEERKREISQERVKELEDLLNQYKVGSWNHFEKYDKNVLDGRSFSLSIHMVSGESISAQGYMKWPKNYGEVKMALKEFFEGDSYERY